jgi:hypothetical protein
MLTMAANMAQSDTKVYCMTINEDGASSTGDGDDNALWQAFILR